jgi:hypothetical protein
MSFISKIGGAVAAAGRDIVTDARGQAAMCEVRREHDAWARTAKIGVTYYTVQPTSPLRSDDPFSRAAHSTFTFVKVANWGPHTGQLITDGGTGSWTLWYQYGPFTTTRQTTGADHDAADRRAEAAAMRGAEAAVTAAVQDEMARLYPASYANSAA